MILGIGNDVADITRIEMTLRKFGQRFESRCFTETEQAKAHRRRKAGMKIFAATYAKRFAAKEACAKALGTGLNHGVYWRDMEVVNLPTGQPTMRLSGGALKWLEAMTPAGMQPAIHLTMTDDHPHAHAVVIISAIAVSSVRG